jgi:hypothetical protein
MSNGTPRAREEAHLQDLILAELELHRAAAASRAENARRSARLKSQRVREGIRRAIGHLPARAQGLGAWNLTSQVLDWIGIKGPESFGLERLPCRRTVCAEIKAMGREKDVHDAASCIGRYVRQPDALDTETPGVNA